MPQMMFDDPDGLLTMLRDSAAAFAASHPGPKALRAGRARGDDVDPTIWRAMAQAGWLGLGVPVELGGAGLGMREQAVLCEALGRALLPVPLAQLGVMATALLVHSPADSARDQLLSGIADGSRLVSPGWQRADGATAAVAVTVVPDGFQLDGEVHFLAAPAAASDLLLFGRIGDAPCLVAVPAGASGLAWQTRPTVDGSRLGCLTLRACRVAGSAMIATSSAASAALESAILETRLALAAELAGIASRALEMATQYTKERQQFGRAIASFQAIQHRLVDMWGEAEFACAAVVNAVETLLGSGGKPGTLAVLAAKARAGDAAVTITRRAIHLYGAMGFTDECDIGLYMKRAVNLNATLGQPEALRLEFVALERAA